MKKSFWVILVKSDRPESRSRDRLQKDYLKVVAGKILDRLPECRCRKNIDLQTD